MKPYCRITRQRALCGNGATSHITSDPFNAYDWADIPPGNENVVSGSAKRMRVVGVGSLNLQTHVATDFNLKLTGVYVTEVIDFNQFSIHDAPKRQEITLDKHSVHLSTTVWHFLVTKPVPTCMRHV